MTSCELPWIVFYPKKTSSLTGKNLLLEYLGSKRKAKQKMVELLPLKVYLLTLIQTLSMQASLYLPSNILDPTQKNLLYHKNMHGIHIT